MSSTPRDRYHHGDLAKALSDAALDLARAGGPEAVVLRAAARQVGVSPTAAYRHFSGHEDLIETVKFQCQLELVGRMQTEMEATGVDPDPQRETVRQLRALGRGYLRFAQEEPGLFRTAFLHSPTPSDNDWAGLLEAPGFRQLTTTIDTMQASGVIDAAHREGAELVAWAGVHGLAVLVLDGPLRMLTPEQLAPVVARSLDAIVTGVLGREFR